MSQTSLPPSELRYFTDLGQYGWQDLDQLDPVVRMQILVDIKDFIQRHPAAIMEHDPDWLYAKCGTGKSAKFFFLLADDGSLSAYAPFFVHPSTLSFEILGISLWEYRICRYSITAGPLLSEKTDANKALTGLFNYLRSILSDRKTLFGLGIEPESPFGQFIQNNTEFKKKFKLVPSGSIYCRRLIELPANFDQYIQNLGYGTRKEVRRVLRRLEQNPEIDLSYHIFTTPADVAGFLPMAQQVSDKTYQHNLLGLGLSNNAETNRNLTTAAENGWLRSYLLMCNQVPVVFQHGYLYKGTYYAEQTGYDPAWKDKSVGTVAQIYRIRDLISDGVTRLDFLYGDNEKKKSLSNTYRIEQNFHLIPKKFSLHLLAYFLLIFNSLSQWIGNFIEKWELKSKLRRYLRKRSVN